MLLDLLMPVVLVVTGADRRALAQLDAQRIHGIVRKPFDSEELASLVVACAEIRSRLNLGTMAIATMIAGSPFLAWLNGFCVGQTILSARAGRIACATPFHPSR